MYNLEDGDVLRDFPILVENGLREKLYFQLLDWEVPTTALYYRLIDPLKGSGFESMQNISADILNLPIHQDIEREDLKIMVDRLVAALKAIQSLRR